MAVFHSRLYLGCPTLLLLSCPALLFRLSTPVSLCSTEGGKKERLVTFTTCLMIGRLFSFSFIDPTLSTNSELR